MAFRSKEKGSKFERELAAFFTEKLGVSVMRSLYTNDPMVRKGKGNSDLIGLPELALEAKRSERFNVHEAMAQATVNASGDEMPVVVHRRSRQTLEESHVIIKLEDFVKIYRLWGVGEGYFKPEKKNV